MMLYPSLEVDVSSSRPLTFMSALSRVSVTVFSTDSGPAPG